MTATLRLDLLTDDQLDELANHSALSGDFDTFSAVMDVLTTRSTE